MVLEIWDSVHVLSRALIPLPPIPRCGTRLKQHLKPQAGFAWPGFGGWGSTEMAGPVGPWTGAHSGAGLVAGPVISWLWWAPGGEILDGPRWAGRLGTISEGQIWVNANL